MRWSTGTAAPERARPLLGTIVTIRVEMRAATPAEAAIARAFAEIAEVHRLMSFQEATSEVARINRLPPGERLGLDPRTADCLARALGHAAASAGAFDPVVGGVGDWRDVALAGDEVRLSARITIDLSGIAKGYAVDRAIASLLADGASHAVVEAGGDLRVLGDRAEEIALRPFDKAPPALVALADGALASSDASAVAGVHHDGRGRRPAAHGFASVVAPDCTDADALTKCVLALGVDAAPLLDRFGAVGHLYRDGAWRTIGGAA